MKLVVYLSLVVLALSSSACSSGDEFLFAYYLKFEDENPDYLQDLLVKQNDTSYRDLTEPIVPKLIEIDGAVLEVESCSIYGVDNEYRLTMQISVNGEQNSAKTISNFRLNEQKFDKELAGHLKINEAQILSSSIEP